MKFNNIEIEQKKGESPSAARDRAVRQLKLEAASKPAFLKFPSRTQTKVSGLDYTPDGSVRTN